MSTDNDDNGSNGGQSNELADMKRKFDQQSALTQELLAASKRPRSTKLNEELCTLVKNHVRKITFKTFKFIQTPDQEQMFINAVTDRMKLSEHEGEGAEPAKKRAQFQLEYAKFMKKALNECRNCVQSEMKKMAHLFMEHNNTNELPPMIDLLQCLQRKLPLTDANEKSIVFYFDFVMPKANGNGEDYNEKIRYCETISEAKSDADRPEVDITPETEAFGLIVVENNRKKWMKLKELDTPDKKGNRVLKVQIGKRADHKDRKESKNYYLYTDEHPELATKYTEPNSGSKDNGGWSMNGVKRYSIFWKHAHKARNAPEGKKWEADALKFLSKKNEITELTHALQRNKSGKRVDASGVAAAPVLDVKDLFGDVDPNEDLEDLIEEV